jgi:hypothetical protein
LATVKQLWSFAKPPSEAGAGKHDPSILLAKPIGLHKLITASNAIPDALVCQV